MRKCVFGLTCSLLILTAPCASAGDLTPPAGPVDSTMKPLDVVEPRIVVESLPGDATATYVISEPGSYYLSGNLMIGTEVGISINAPHVTLDLMGHRIHGGGPFALKGIVISDSSGSVVIRDGVITSFAEEGVVVTGQVQATLESVSIENCAGLGVRANDFFMMRHCSVRETAGVLVGDHARIMDSTILRSDQGVEMGEHGFVTRCEISQNTAFGVKADFYGRVTQCELADNAVGIDALAGATIEDCRLTNHTEVAIRGTNRSRIVRNFMLFNTVGVLVAAGQNMVTDNHSFNNSTGFQSLNSTNLILRNTATGNLVPFSVQPGDVAPVVTNPAGAPDANLNVVY